MARLLGYDMSRTKAQVDITLYWLPLAPIPGDFHVFVHAEGGLLAGSPQGIWGQSDGVPVCGLRPTESWQPDEVIVDPRRLTLKPETPPGDYPLLVGLYDPTSGQRLDVLDDHGSPAGNYVQLTTLQVPPP
jgi:hypothetical protein